MKVDVLHGYNLSVAAACSSSLDAEYRSERRLTESYNGLLADLSQSVCKTYGCGGLTFTCRGGCDSCHQDQLAVGITCPVLQKLVVDLCFVFSVLFYIFVTYSYLLSDFSNRSLLAFLCDLNICLTFCHFFLLKHGWLDYMYDYIR